MDTSQLVVAYDSLGPGQFDPEVTGHDNITINAPMFDTLTMVDYATGDYVGGLAESYSVSDDGLTWTFKLRPNIPFHDGWGTVKASDVKYTWGIWITDASTHDLGSQLKIAVDGNMDNFKIINDLEFTVTASAPMVTLPSVLSDFGNGLQVVPERYYAEKGEEALNHPIGTGPWKFSSFTTGVEMVYEAVKDHWRKPPAFDKLIFKEIPDGAARLAQLQSGDVDMALAESSLLGEAAANGIETRVIENTTNLTLILGGSYWGSDLLDRDSPWIQADTPEKGQLIREAMSLAIDREPILDTILGGLGRVATGPGFQNAADPRVSDPSWAPPEFNMELAKQKLADGGYPNGFPVEIFMYPKDFDTVGIAEAIAGNWEELGLQVNRVMGEAGTIDGYTTAPPNTNGRVWVKPIGVKADVTTQMSGYVKTRDDNKFFWPKLDENFPLMIAEPDATKRYALAKEVIASLRDSTVAITLFGMDIPVWVGPKVGTWDPIPGFDEMSHLETVTPRQ